MIQDYLPIIIRVYLNSSDWLAAGGQVLKPIDLSAICYWIGWTEMKPDGFDNNMRKFTNTRKIWYILLGINLYYLSIF